MRLCSLSAVVDGDSGLCCLSLMGERKAEDPEGVAIWGRGQTRQELLYREPCAHDAQQLLEAQMLLVRRGRHTSDSIRFNEDELIARR
eukprot:5189034-Pleurochrysis_carterae.AAC.1